MSQGPASANGNKATFQYCHGCGEEVLTYAVPSAQSSVEFRCSFCGLPLGRKLSVEQVGVNCVILADDEKFFRWLLRDLLVDQRLSQTVVACESGAELLAKFTERMRSRQWTDMIILDILMKDLDGMATARALRAVETGFDRAHSVPIVFLSCLRPDTSIRNFVARVQPAIFLNKAQDATPDRLALRIRKILEYFARPRDEKTGDLLQPAGAA
jgi:CheY-like chemotaxis protein